jgi:ligand-binding SRPBCC domain-containing protein
MRERTFRNEVRVLQKPENLFEFFADARNLNRITPDWLNFRIINPDIKLQKGSKIVYKLTWRGLPLKWVSEITDWNPPHSFIDKQIQGPYKTWIHTHNFARENDVTRIIDEVQYSVPGSFLEPLIHKFFVGPDVHRIFQFRTRKILEIFEAVKSP